MAMYRKAFVIKLVCSLIVSVNRVGAATVTPETQLMMNKVQSLLDRKAGFGDSAFVRSTYKQLQEKAGEKENNPYTKHVLWIIQQNMEERYTYIKSASVLASTHTDDVEKRRKASLDTLLQDKVSSVTKKEHSPSPTIEEIEAARLKQTNEKKIEEESLVESITQEAITFEIDLVQEEAYDQDQRYALGNGRINVSELKRTWIQWVNDFRIEEGVEQEIVHQPLLDKTATEWAYYQRSIGEWTHRRTPHSAFYDYQEITAWFNDRGIDFTNVQRATHTENVGLSTLYCDGGDCTDEATTSLSRVFKYFIDEKGTNYTAHYDTIVQPYFAEMGFGIAVDESTDTIYSTMHYGTKAIRKPVQLTSR